MAEIAGLKLITPSSVAGSGVSLSGAKVVFTAATTININGVFSATHDNYLIVYRNTASASNEIQYRLRASGSDASGSNYTDQVIYALNTLVGGARRTSQTAGYFHRTGTGNGGTHFYIYGPALAQPTATRDVCASSRDTVSIQEYACTHSLSTAYDGITILPTVGNVTGALCVYGLSQ